jgi:hypothetical protein
MAPRPQQRRRERLLDLMATVDRPPDIEPTHGRAQSLADEDPERALQANGHCQLSWRTICLLLAAAKRLRWRR